MINQHQRLGYQDFKDKGKKSRKYPKKEVKNVEDW